QFPAGAFVRLAKARVAELKSGAHTSKLPKPGRWRSAPCNPGRVQEVILYVDGHDLYGWWWQSEYSRGFDGEFLTHFDDIGEIAPVGFHYSGQNNLQWVSISGTFPAAIKVGITGSTFCVNTVYSFKWVSEN